MAKILYSCRVTPGPALSTLASRPASGILYTWTGSGKIVCTGMYRYVRVYASTGIHLQYILECTGMYQKQDMMVSHTSRQLFESKQ